MWVWGRGSASDCCLGPEITLEKKATRSKYAGALAWSIDSAQMGLQECSSPFPVLPTASLSSRIVQGSLGECSAILD